MLDREARARVQAALRELASPSFVEYGHELLARVRQAAVAFVILELRDRAGTATAPVARAIRDGFPSIPVIAYGTIAGAAPSDILEIARAGADQLVIRGFNDYDLGFRTALVAASSRCTAAVVTERIARDIPPCVTPIVRYCLEHAGESLTVTEVARALGVARQTLAARAREAHVPTPSALVSWCRLFAAARLLEDPGRSVEDVAHALNFPSGTALRNMLRRYVGLRPAEVRENGGLACVLHAFQSATRQQQPVARGDDRARARVAPPGGASA